MEPTEIVSDEQNSDVFASTNEVVFASADVCTSSDASVNESYYNEPNKNTIKISISSILITIFHIYVPVYTFVIYHANEIELPTYVVGYFAFMMYGYVMSRSFLYCCVKQPYKSYVWGTIQAVNIIAATIYMYVIAEWMFENLHVFKQLPYTVAEGSYSLFWLYLYIVCLYIYWWIHLIVGTILTFAISVVVGLLICFRILSICKKRNIERRNKLTLESHTISTIFSKMKERFFNIESCVVCSEDFHADECIRQLSCKHFFHKKCVDGWLIEHGTCPTCRATM